MTTSHEVYKSGRKRLRIEYKIRLKTPPRWQAESHDSSDGGGN